MIASILFIIFFLIVFFLLFVLGILLRGVNSVSEVWRNVTGRGNKYNNPSSNQSTGRSSARSTVEEDQVIGGSSKTDLSSVKDVEFEKE